VRRVNLFEPRWLAMFDLVRRLNSEDGGSGGGGGDGGSGGGSRTVSLENARLGTMHVVNRFYRPVEC